MTFNIPEGSIEKPRIEFRTKVVCPCGHEFYPYRPYQRFCCGKHRIKYSKLEMKKSYYIKKTIETRPCKECGKEFTTNDSKRHYCSKECYLLFQSKRIVPKEKRVCPVCNEEFESAHQFKTYCSKDCRAAARNIRGSKEDD